MARKKEYTPKMLQKKINKYFDSISYQRVVLQKQPDLEKDADGKMRPKIDEYGHVLSYYEVVCTADGKKAMETVWIKAPSIVELSLFLDVDRSTFWRWCNPKDFDSLSDEEREFCNIAMRARGRIEAYLIQQTENPKAARGAIANLEANFGWKRKKEVALDERTQETIRKSAQMTADDKLKFLMDHGLNVPWEEQEQEGTDSDE